MSQLIDALNRVMSHRMAEIDDAIIKSNNEREVAFLWRLRGQVRKILRALTGQK